MIIACFLFKKHRDPKPVNVMKTQIVAHAKTRCLADFPPEVSQRLSGTFVFLLYDNFLQEGNDRAVTELTGTEKDQEWDAE